MVVTQSTREGDQAAARARGEDLEDRSGGGDLGERRGAARPATMPASSRRCRWPQIAAQANATGGPIGAGVQLNTTGAEGGFATHICDVEVDPETGKVRVLRYTVVPGRRPRHPSGLRRGPDAGRRRAGHRLGAERGVHLRQERASVDNPGFLDYRMPVASDLPMLDTRHDRGPEPEASAGRARRRRGAAGAAAGRRSPTPSTTRSACASTACRCRRRRCWRCSTRAEFARPAIRAGGALAPADRRQGPGGVMRRRRSPSPTSRGSRRGRRSGRGRPTPPVIVPPQHLGGRVEDELRGQALRSTGLVGDVVAGVDKVHARHQPEAEGLLPAETSMLSSVPL